MSNQPTTYITHVFEQTIFSNPLLSDNIAWGLEQIIEILKDPMINDIYSIISESIYVYQIPTFYSILTCVGMALEKINTGISILSRHKEEFGIAMKYFARNEDVQLYRPTIMPPSAFFGFLRNAPMFIYKFHMVLPNNCLNSFAINKIFTICNNNFIAWDVVGFSVCQLDAIVDALYEDFKDGRRNKFRSMYIHTMKLKFSFYELYRRFIARKLETMTMREIDNTHCAFTNKMQAIKAPISRILNDNRIYHSWDAMQNKYCTKDEPHDTKKWMLIWYLDNKFNVQPTLAT